MRLTRAGEYAVRCMVYLAYKGQGVLVVKQEIATQADIPGPFLAKIVQNLARAHLIEIRQGPKGGYILMKDPAEISLLEVVEVMIGKIQLNDCVGRPETCATSGRCRVHRVWEDSSAQLRQHLAGITFAELSRDDSCLPVFSVHNKKI
ncbi:MAG: Rrf2 family transcriptional regulator [Proteobacteria bacterium]|nr:Rrf2 family transcriptional regulator [Desulfocapsa sp.]MBU3946543.1 Rrf2 family transcriptional regulator [Pseudomonadota bacterium]MCG2745333.1 Rrf2 family transcriptional regulator [Desulfobacteraceae bacterium]MBU3982384.1 Rrf2 family transcriptional regulator [Pseudomonadota bacterium]MBU4028403.1 Rrf2 family transcriptional regulator [Pseudomonadota bacterium]